jgi:hypothetical protein
MTQEAKPKIVDVPLTHTVSMGQGACCFCFCIPRQPMLDSWMAATNRHCSCPGWKARNNWCCFDAHFQNAAVTEVLAILPIKAANMVAIHSSYEITFQFPFIQDPQLLWLSWCSFQCIVHSASATINNCIDNYLPIFVVFLPDRDSALWQSQVQ